MIHLRCKYKRYTIVVFYVHVCGYAWLIFGKLRIMDLSKNIFVIKLVQKSLCTLYTTVIQTSREAKKAFFYTLQNTFNKIFKIMCLDFYLAQKSLSFTLSHKHIKCKHFKINQIAYIVDSC